MMVTCMPQGRLADHEDGAREHRPAEIPKGG
eukprot:COSAG01_NODE_73762_length_237_cov_3.521739_2_plen_30_part_01